MTDVVNTFDLDDFDYFLENDLPVHPATILAKKLAKLLRSVNPDLCHHAQIVQLKDGSFFCAMAGQRKQEGAGARHCR
jgi:hypothetical protein